VAGLHPHELAVNRGSDVNALKAHAEKETSHGPYCDRSGFEGITGLRTDSDGRDPGGAANGNAVVGQVPRAKAAQPGGPRDVRGSILSRGCGPRGGSRGSRGASDAGAVAGGGRARGEDGHSGCAKPQRSVVPDESATDGACAGEGVTRSQIDVRNAGGTGPNANEANQPDSWLDATAGTGRDPQRLAVDVSSAREGTRGEPWRNDPAVRRASAQDDSGTIAGNLGRGRRARGRRSVGSDVSAADDGTRRWSDHGGEICGSDRRCRPVRRCTQGAVVSGTDARREVQRPEAKTDGCDEGRIEQTTLGSRAGGVGGAAILQGPSRRRVVVRGGEPPREGDRGNGTRAQAGRHSVRDVARWRSVREKPSRRGSESLTEPQSALDFTANARREGGASCPEMVIAKTSVKHCRPNRRSLTSRLRVRPIDGHQPLPPKSANSRVRQRASIFSPGARLTQPSPPQTASLQICS